MPKGMFSRSLFVVVCVGFGLAVTLSANSLSPVPGIALSSILAALPVSLAGSYRKNRLRTGCG